MSSEHPRTSEAIWQFGGPILGLAWQDRYIYLAVGPTLLVVDVEDWQTPRIVGRSAPLAGPLKGLAVDGDHAYATTANHLHVFQVGDPTSPRVAGACLLPRDRRGTRCDIEQISPMGDHVYLARRANSSRDLLALDVSDPHAPRVVGEPHPGDLIVARGSIAYRAHPAGLEVVDVSDPATPVQISSVALTTIDSLSWDGKGGRVTALAVLGDHVWYVSSRPYPDGYKRVVIGNTERRGTHPTYVIDVADPRSPRETGSFPTEAADRLAVSGTRVYLASRSASRPEHAGTLTTVDVSDPAAPTRLGVYYARGGIGEVAAKGEMVAFSDHRGRWLSLVNLRDPTGRPPESELGLPGAAHAVGFAAGYAYVGMDDGLHVLDVSDPSTPREAGVYPPKTGVRGLVLRGGYAWAYGGRELRIFDLTDPARPLAVDAFRTTYRSEAFLHAEVGQQFACVLVADEREVPEVHVYRLADPGRPEPVGDLAVEGTVQAIAIDGQYAVVVSRSGRGERFGWDDFVRLFDLANLRELAVIGPSASQSAGGVFLTGLQACVWRGADARLFDLRDFDRPVERGVVQLTGATGLDTVIHAAAATGTRLFLASRQWLHVFDVSSPEHPVEVERRPHVYVGEDPTFNIRILLNQATSEPDAVSVYGAPYWGHFGGLTQSVLAGEYLYLARGDEGFWIHRLLGGPGAG